LKLSGLNEIARVLPVAPLAGAWIETAQNIGRYQISIPVAPLAGAWIETLKWF